MVFLNNFNKFFNLAAGFLSILVWLHIIIFF